MRDYGQIQCSFWTDPDIQGLSDQARALACYLLTGPHSNGLGCYRLPDGYIYADFGWDQETVSKGFAELFAIGFCNRCTSTNFVLIPKFLHWNPISNSNVAKAREKEFRTVPQKAQIYQELMLSMSEYGKYWSKGLVNRFETLSKGYGKQEPNLTEQEPEQEPTRKPLSSSASEPDRVRQVFEHWQVVMDHPKAKLDDKRRAKIKKRLADGYTVRDLCAAVDGCRRSPHHMGENDRGTRYDDIELICRDAPHVDKFIKLANSPNMVDLGSAGRQTANAAMEWINAD